MKMTPVMRTTLRLLSAVVVIFGLLLMGRDMSVMTGVDQRLLVLPIIPLYIYLKFFRKA